MALQVVRTQVLEGGHTIVYLRSTDSGPFTDSGERPDAILSRVMTSDPKTDVDPAALADVINALHGERRKIVRDIAAKEAHHATLVEAIAQLPDVLHDPDASLAVARLKTLPLLAGRQAFLVAQLESKREEHDLLDVALAAKKAEHAEAYASVSALRSELDELTRSAAALRDDKKTEDPG